MQNSSSATQSTPQSSAIPPKQIAAIVGWLFLLGGGFAVYKIGPELGWWSNRESASPAEVLPQVTIEPGTFNSAYTFGPWQKGDRGYGLMTMVTYRGSTIQLQMKFAAYGDGGVKLDEGFVTRPSLKLGETGKAEMAFTDPKIRRISVFIEPE